MYNTAAVPPGSPPTSYAAYATLSGEPGSILRFAGLTVLRSLLIAPGMALAGVRGKQLLWGSLAASGFVSLSALAYCYALAQKDKLQQATRPGVAPASAADPVIDTTAAEVR